MTVTVTTTPEIPFSIAADQSKITFSPNTFSQLGPHTVTVTLADDFGDQDVPQTFTVTVFNDAPIFT